MNKLIVLLQKNRYFYAVAKLMLFSASVHMAILFYLAISGGTLSLLNFFDILDLERLFPVLIGSHTKDIVSIAVAFLLYVLFIFV